MLNCDACGAEILDIDIKCGSCGHSFASTGAHRLIGTVLLGQYEIVDILGQGGMSVVYKGRHKLTEQTVALKILPPELAAHSQVKSRFVEEAKALAQLDHPNIVHLYNFGEENGSFVLAMQFVEGQTWERSIVEHEEQEWGAASWVCCDVLRALEFAHTRGIVHRDMKPSNVLIRADDGSATVMDFGIAKMTTSTRLTATGQTMGTVRYMSPEQVRGQEVDLRTDVYSLGATLYEAVTGETPFDGDTHFDIMTKHLNEAPAPPSEYGVDSPPDFEAVLLRSLAKAKEERFQSAAEFREALEGVLVAHDRVREASAGSAPRSLARPVTAVPEASAVGRGDRAPTAIALRNVSGGGPSPKAKWWLGAAAVAVIAAGITVVGVTRGGSGTTEARTAPSQDAAAAKPVDQPRPPYQPPGLRFAADQTFASARMRVMSVVERDLAHISDIALAAEQRFAALINDANGVTVTRRWLSLQLLARSAFCDKGVFTEYGRLHPQFHQCDGMGAWYRVSDSTLVVVDEPGKTDVNVADGLAMVICILNKSAGCSRLMEQFEAENRRRARAAKKRKKPRKRGSR